MELIEYEVVYNGEMEAALWRKGLRSAEGIPGDLPTPREHGGARISHAEAREVRRALASLILRAMEQKYYSYYDLVALTNVPRTTLQKVIRELVARKAIESFQQYQRRTGKLVTVYGRPEFRFPLQPQGKRPCIVCEQWKAPSDFTIRSPKCRTCLRAYWAALQRKATRAKQQPLFGDAA